MKQRIMASLLVFLLVFSLIPLMGAKEAGEVEAEPAAFGGDSEQQYGSSL